MLARTSLVGSIHSFIRCFNRLLLAISCVLIRTSHIVMEPEAKTEMQVPLFKNEEFQDSNRKAVKHVSSPSRREVGLCVTAQVIHPRSLCCLGYRGG